MQKNLRLGPWVPGSEHGEEENFVPEFGHVLCTLGVAIVDRACTERSFQPVCRVHGRGSVPMATEGGAAVAHTVSAKLRKRHLSSRWTVSRAVRCELNLRKPPCPPTLPDLLGNAHPVFCTLPLWWAVCVWGVLFLTVPFSLRITCALSSPSFTGVHLAGDCSRSPSRPGGSGCSSHHYLPPQSS